MAAIYPRLLGVRKRAVKERRRKGSFEAGRGKRERSEKDVSLLHQAFASRDFSKMQRGMQGYETADEIYTVGRVYALVTVVSPPSLPDRSIILSLLIAHSRSVAFSSRYERAI